MASRQRRWRASVKLWTSCRTSRSGGCADLSHLGQIQDVPGSWKLSVAQSFISARTVIDGEQNPPSNPRSEDEGEFSVDVVVSMIFFLQSKKACLLTVVQCIKRSSRGEIKPLWHCGKVTASAGSYDNWPARQTKYFPQHKQQQGVYYKTGVNKHVLKGTNSKFSRGGGVGWSNVT